MKYNEFSSRIGSAFNDDTDCGTDDADDRQRYRNC